MIKACGRIFCYAKNRALRGFRHGKYKKHAMHVFYICRDRYAPLQSLAHEPSGAVAKGSPWLRAPVELVLCEAGFRGSPCCLGTTTRSPVRVPVWAPPLNWFFVKPSSGARRATWVTNNTLTGSRAGLGESLAHEPGQLCWANPGVTR
jgi:hypothetical protein